MLQVITSRFRYFVISGGLFILSLFAILFFPLNLGIDMTWGTQSEFRYDSYEIDLDNISQIIENQKQLFNEEKNTINTVSAYKITWEKSFVVEVGFVGNDNVEQLEQDKVAFRDTIESLFSELWDIELSGYTNIGASFWDYIKDTARITLIIAIIAIALYIAYAFSWAVSGISSTTFAIVTIITLFHDVFISTGLYIATSTIFPEFQIDTFFITALLTILGYSINDTIVIFDRIRSNLQAFGGKWKKLDEIINISVSESLTRSIYTSATLGFVLFCILLFGPESIAGFTLAMIYGTLVGTFSSIFIASPLLYEINKDKELKVYEKKEVSADDKIVV